MQIDEAERGFSFRFDGPLDMRMDIEGDQPTAADIVNTYEADDLANVIYEYGEERLSRRVARAIVMRRAEQKFSRTSDLADVVRSAVPKSPKDKIDPATRTFQALRLAVNDELGELDRALEASEHVLAHHGRLVVVSFHSLEDGRVKRYMKRVANAVPSASRHMPQNVYVEDVVAPFTLPSRKTVKPSKKEIDENLRSRSARLRMVIRQKEEQGGCA